MATMERNNVRPEGQQELGFSTRFYKEIGFLMASLLTLIQVKSQNSRNPFKTHGAIMSLFILSMLVYVVVSAWISKLAPNTSYLPILKHVHSIFVTFACGLLLVILVPPVGWLMVVICASMFVKLLCGAHEQILECITQAFNKLCDWFQNSFQSLCQAGSRAFNLCGWFLNVLCGWFQNSFQSLCQAGSRAFNLCGWFQNSLQSLYQAVSRAFNKPLMPTELTASSTERQGVEMARIVVESPKLIANSTEQQGGENGRNSDRI